MIKKLITAFSLLFFFLAANAQGGIVLGYSNGQIAAASTKVLSGEGRVSAAVRLPAAMVSGYEGSNISAIRVGLVDAANIDTLTVWVRRSLAGANLAETKISGNDIKSGWNEVVLSAPYTLGSRTIYIGYTFHQTASANGVSIVGNGTGQTSFVDLGEQGWEDVGSAGQLSLEALVSGDNVPDYDLGITSATISPDPTNGLYALKATVKVQNVGKYDVNGFDLNVASSGVSIPVHLSDIIPSAQSREITFVVNPDKDTEESGWTVAVTGIDGHKDGNAGNDTMSAGFTYLQNVALEEFSTLRCMNCPRVAGYLHTALDGLGNLSDRVATVTHHSGFYTDRFTKWWDEPLTWLYVNGNYYAPALLVNRQPEFDDTEGDGKCTAFIPESPEEIRYYIDRELNKAAKSAIGVQLQFNADSTSVDVTVNMRKTASYNTVNPRITVYLIENHIPTTDQSGASDSVFMQEHVARQCNATWGDSVVWTGNYATYRCTFAIDKTWIKSNMEVMAFLGNYNEKNKLDCVIDNSAKAVFSSDEPVVTAINSVTDNTSSRHEVARYDITGKRINEPVRGINIVKFSDGTVRKLVVR